jgi:hypothetical protein
MHNIHFLGVPYVYLSHQQGRTVQHTTQARTTSLVGINSLRHRTMMTVIYQSDSHCHCVVKERGNLIEVIQGDTNYRPYSIRINFLYYSVENESIFLRR